MSLSKKKHKIITLWISLIFGTGIWITPLSQSAQAISTSVEKQIITQNLDNFSEDWISSLQEEILQSEYQITWQEESYLEDIDQAYQAPNRAQNLRTYFTPSGIRIIPREFADDVPPWQLSLKLKALDENHIFDTATFEPLMQVKDNRAEYHYRRNSSNDWDIIQWYENEPQGLRQGFTISATKPLMEKQLFTIEIQMSGNLTPLLDQEGKGVLLLSADGVPTLLFNYLQAKDAKGNQIASEFSLHHSRTDESTILQLSLSIKNDHITYPITIEFLTGSQPWSVEGDNKVEIELGHSVATAGDVNGDGYSDIIIGAPNYDAGQTNEGRVYVYHGSSAGLSTTPNWLKEINKANANFGWSVATAGDINGDGYFDVVIGAPGYTDGQSNEGAAYVFLGSSKGLKGE